MVGESGDQFCHLLRLPGGQRAAAELAAVVTVGHDGPGRLYPAQKLACRPGLKVHTDVVDEEDIPAAPPELFEKAVDLQGVFRGEKECFLFGLRGQARWANRGGKIGDRLTRGGEFSADALYA